MTAENGLAAPGAEIVLDDPQLRLRYQPGRSNRLILVFSSFATKKRWFGVSDTAFSGSASGKGRHHVLFVVDKPGSYGLAPGMMQKIHKAALQICGRSGLNRIDILSSSMGAYSAFLFTQICDVNTVIAFAPPVFIDSRCRVFDNRADAWLYNVPQGQALPSLLDMLDAPECIYMAHGLRCPDAAHAAMVPAANHLRHYLFPASGHTVSKFLKAEDQLDAFVSAAFADDLTAADAAANQCLGFRKGQVLSAQFMSALYDGPECAQAQNSVPEQTIIDAIRQDTDFDPQLTAGWPMSNDTA